MNRFLRHHRRRSELGWVGWFVEPASDTKAPGDSPQAQLALSYLKDMAFVPNPPASFTLADVKFTAQEFAQVDALGNAIYNANDPDLRAFAAHGGKLIMYHGWADQAIPPWSTLDYYAAVEQAMGGFQASQAFSRLYMIPGAYHCLAGPHRTYNLANFLTPLIGWVQRGTPPGIVQADTYSKPLKTFTLKESVKPYNALAPVTPAPGSLNGDYRYIGKY
jgi:Tannase and feruloyl esterase